MLHHVPVIRLPAYYISKVSGIAVKVSKESVSLYRSRIVEFLTHCFA